MVCAVAFATAGWQKLICAYSERVNTWISPSPSLKSKATLSHSRRAGGASIIFSRINIIGLYLQSSHHKGLDIRFVITSIHTGAAEHVYGTLYCARGRMENLIKLHKAQLASDRTRCRGPLANQMPAGP